MRLQLLFILLFGITTQAQEQLTPRVLTGFSHPESVVYDESQEHIYVSNIGKKEEGDGFISMLSKKGEILDISWITGLNDPKGLLVDGNSLWVTDNTEVVEMDISSGEIVRKIEVEGAEFLNDLAKDESGNIFISDTGKSSIYILKTSGEIEEWLNGPELENPNGLLVTSDAILVAAWGNENPGNVLKVDRETKETEKISGSGIGNLDGIQKISEEEYFISDWATGNIYRINKNGELEEKFTSAKSAGDILFLKSENKLYLPMNHQNEVWIYPAN